MRPWRRWLSTDRVVGLSHYVHTSDGVALHLIRLQPAERRHATPILLLHGLGGNRHTFHLPGRSLALHLAEHGFDCYVAELRGAGQSATRPSWDLDDHLRYDIPALIDGILALSGATQLHWVGHSMGGILLLAYGCMRPDAPIARGVTIASAVNLRGSETGFGALLPLLPLLGRLRSVPYAGLAHALAPLVGYVTTGLERFNVHPPNADPRHTRRLLANGFGEIPTALLSQLATLMSAEGLRLGEVRMPALFARFRLPMVMLAGSVDAQVSVAAVRATADALGVPSAVRCFGREQGHSADYGHFDLIMGRRAPQEVWPELRAWLASA